MIKPRSQLSSSKYRISVRDPALWNEFLTDSEKEIENLLPFKVKLNPSYSHMKNKTFFLMTFMCIFIPTSISDNTQQRKITANTTQ